MKLPMNGRKGHLANVPKSKFLASLVVHKPAEAVAASSLIAEKASALPPPAKGVKRKAKVDTSKSGKAGRKAKAPKHEAL